MAGTKRSKEPRSSHWRRVVAEWERSGLTQRAFCHRRRIPTGTFGWWKHHLSDRAAEPGPKFVAVSLPSGGLEPVDAVEPGLSGPDQTWPLEVRLSDGTHVRVGPSCEEALLERVLKALRVRRC